MLLLLLRPTPALTFFRNRLIRASLRRIRVVLGVTLLLLVVACSTPKVAPGYYQVQAGDTLTKIARLHHRSIADLKRWNKLPNSAQIEVGQLLRVTPPDSLGPEVASTSTPVQRPARAAAANPAAKIDLVWPANGTIRRRFNGSSSNGLLIANAAGTSIVAAAAGTVAYAGNGVRGYGNMIIVRHAANFLTIYAHNRRLLVKQDQKVVQGQKIAEMGNSDSDQVALYFELRYDGRAIDPSRSLPAR